MSQRLQLCICSSLYRKRNQGSWKCLCSASIIKSRVLLDSTYKHWFITPGKLRSELALCSEELIERFLKSLSQEEVQEYKRVVPGIAVRVLKQKKPVPADPAEKVGESVKMAPGKKVEKSKIEDAEVVLTETYKEALNKILDSPLAGVTDAFTGLLEVLLKTFEYRGFDVKKIQQIVAYRQSLIPTGETIYLTEDQKSKLPIGGVDNLNNVILFSIAIFNHRGNNLEAIKSGLTPNVLHTFDAFVNHMVLRSNVLEKGTKAKNPNVLTLARIAAAFPIHALKLAIQEQNVRKVVNMADIGLTHGRMGKALSHPVAPSVLDDDMIKSNAVFITFLTSYRLNQLIGGKNKADPERLWLFHKAALASPAVKRTDRTAFWETIVKDEDQPTLLACGLAAKGVLKGLIDDELIEEIEAYTLPMEQAGE